jgi:hypothetical protein
MQDINTVNADLQRPMQNFEDFPDHITEHVNHYDSLASFMQPCANITKIKTFRESIQRWPQFDSVITSWEEQNPNVLTRDFQDFTTYLLTRFYNLDQDVKPRPRRKRMHTPLAKAAKENPKEKAAGGAAAKVKERAKTTAKGAHSQTTTNLSNHSSDHAYTNAEHRQWSTSIPLQTATTLLTPTLDHKLRIDHNNLPQIVRSFACTVPAPPRIS